MNTESAPKMPPLPARIAKLPRNARGYPVPYFVAWIDGAPDFRLVRPEVLREATQKKLCWICGEPLGASQTFVIGPMCAVNRTNAEPPSHRDCAEFAVQACPFMLKPAMERREDERTQTMGHDAAGIMIKRNPGVMACWTTKRWTTFPDHNGRTLFNIGKPSHISWWREGRAATFAEVKESILSGIPLLEEHCADEEEKAVLMGAVGKTLLLASETIRA